MQDAVFTGNLVGLDRDTQPELQQDGTYRFALNMQESMNSIAQIENMNSNELCVDLPGKIIGSVFLVDKFVLFLADTGVSEIGLFDPDKCTYSKIDIACDLNFSVDAPIQASYKISISCEDYTIYWTDGINPVRYLDIGNPPEDCNDLNLFSCLDVPELKVVGVGAGGSLACGSYQFSMRYSDGKGNKTNFFGITNPIPIYVDSLESSNWLYVDGCEGGELTTKSITLDISNTDLSYDYIDIAILYYANGVAIHKLLERQPNRNGYITINTNAGTDLDVLEVITPLARWKYADYLLSHQDRLFLGGMQEIKDLEFQKYANNIKVKWFTSKVDINTAMKAYKNPLMHDFRTFIGDEKYALAIVLEYCNGTFSPAFHIPGPTAEEITCLEFPIKSKLKPPGTLTDIVDTYPDIQYTSIYDIVPENDVNNFFSCDKYVWEVFNTAGICSTPEIETEIEEDCGIITGTKVGQWHIGHMAYSEECETYPDIRGCDGLPIYPYDSGDCDTTFNFTWGYIHDINTIPQGTIFNLGVSPSISIDSVYLTVKDLNGSVLYSQATLNAFVFDQLLLNAGVTLNVTVISANTTLTVSVPIDATTQNCYNCPQVQFTCLGEIQMAKVRHHRFPTRKLEPLFSNQDQLVQVDCSFSPSTWNIPPFRHYIYPLAVEVTDIEIPPFLEDVKGYKLVFVKRNDSNRSVIGKGIIHGSFKGEDTATSETFIFPRYCVNDATIFPPTLSSYNPSLYEDHMTVKKFHSPDTSFSQDRFLNALYFSYEAALGGVSRCYGVEGRNTLEEDCCAARFNINIIKHNQMFDYQHNSPVVKSTYIENNTILSGVYSLPYSNLLGESGVLFDATTDYAFKDISTCDIDTDFYESISIPGGLTYEFFYPPLYNDNSYFLYFNEPENCTQNVSYCVRSFYGALKSYKCNQYGDLSNLQYIELNTQYLNPNIPAITYNIRSFGDGFINYWAYKRQGGAPALGEYTAECYTLTDAGILTDLQSGPYYPYTALIHTIVESDINVDLRHSEEDKTYYPNLVNGQVDLDVTVGLNSTEFENCFLSEFHRNLDTKTFTMDRIGNHYKYNFDFSRLNDQRVYSAIPLNYEPCDCKSTYTNAIVASESSQGQSDGWRTFKAASIINIPKNTGKIRNIVSMKNNLFAHTENNIWQITTSQTKIESNATNVYLGTGDMFSSIPQYIYAVPEGYAGIKQKLGYVLNQLGYWFIDDKAAKIYTLDEGVSEIEKGLIDWLHDNLVFSIFKYIPDYILNPIKDIGWLIGYDYKLRTIFITKKDFDLKNPELFKGEFNEADCEQGSIYLYNGKFIYTIVDPEDYSCAYSYIEYTDEEYFCNKSWTLSYSLLRKSFKSWHSFIPDYYLYDRYNLFTAKGSALYKHNIPHHYQTYYGEYYPAQIELVTKSQITSHWDNALYVQDATIYDSVYKKDLHVDETFTKGVLYNRTQNSGLFNLVKVTDFDQDYMQLAIKESTDEFRVVRKNDTWTYNGFTDYVIDNTIPHNTCECIDPIDQVPNTDAIDSAKPYYQVSPFRGMYIIQRLYLDNATKYNVKYRLTLLSNTITNVTK